MKRFKSIAAVLAAGAAIFVGAFAGCATPDEEKEAMTPQTEYTEDYPDIPSDENIQTEIQPGEPEKPEAEIPKESETPKEPTQKTVTYLQVTAEGVNIRSGAGTSYSVRGTAEKSTLYALDATTNGWYKTAWRNQSGYISTKYCQTVHMRASTNVQIEAVVEEGLKLLGTPYVYGAVRYMDSNGKKLSGFTTNAFDCSSLMQYIFYKGAGKVLDVNTRTQVKQGKTVKRADLQRGDILFFTNASRKNLSGIERIGHVALYLGDNYILHTASDYAKIEQISATRWGYFIQGQRIL